MKFIKILVICLLSFLSSSLIGQDVIIKKNGDKLKVQVKEISDTQVKYIESGDPNEILFTIDRALIKEIKFSYGGNYKEEEPEANMEYFAEDRNNNLMVNFTALGNALIVGYERAIDHGSSFDVQFKLLGLGIDNDDFDETSGIGIDLGYKFKFGTITKKSGEYRPKHLLHGGYFKPLIGFATGSVNGSAENFSLGHLGLQIGKQWILQKRVSLDLYLGFHYYTGGNNGNLDFIDTIRIGDFAGVSNRAGSFGFRVGYLFGRYGYENEKKSRR